MGNTCGKGGKGKKSAKVGNHTQGSDKDGSLIHSDRSGGNNRVEKISKLVFRGANPLFDVPSSLPILLLKFA